MLTFMDAYVLWRAVPFPHGAFGNELPETQADLVLADDYATTVIRYVEEGIFRPAVPDVLGLIDTILERTAPALWYSDADLRRIAREQHAYAALLKVLYAEFLRCGAAGKGSGSDC